MKDCISCCPAADTYQGDTHGIVTGALLMRVLVNSVRSSGRRHLHLGRPAGPSNKQISNYSSIVAN